MLLENEHIKQFQNLWNDIYTNKISETEAEIEAQKLLALITLIVHKPTKKHEN